MSHVVIDGVRVSFFRRDVRLVNDREMEQLRELVADEQSLCHGRLSEIVLMTNHLGPGMSYQTTTRVHVRGTGE